MSRKTRSQGNPTVKPLDENKAKEALKSCPKIVKDYVKALNDVIRSQGEVQVKAIQKIRELSKNNSDQRLVDLLNFCFDNSIDPWNNETNKDIVRKFKNNCK